MTPDVDPQYEEMELLKLVPQTTYSRLIVRHGFERDTELALAYSDAARRLASTFAGRNEDDLLLLPYLMLYRQAFELTVKNLIWTFADYRRRLLDPHEPSVQRSAVKKAAWGHELGSLLDTMLTHFKALNMSDDLPIEVEHVIRALAHDDPSGTGFRYANYNRVFRCYADFLNLASLLDGRYDELLAFADWADDLLRSAPTEAD